MEILYKFIWIDNNNMVYIEPSTGFWSIFNYTAELIISSFLQGISIEDITKKMSDIYNLPSEIFKDDIDKCIDSFQKKLDSHKSLVEQLSVCGDTDGHLTIHLTNTCNLKCPYCYKDTNNLKMNDKELSVEEIVSSIKTASKNGFSKVTFSGGEPTLWEHFKELLNELKAFKDIEFHLITNGTTNLPDEIIKKMCSVFKSIQISIDSYDEEKNSITRGRGSLDKVSEFSKRLFNEDYKEFFYTCTPYTHGMKYQSTIEDLPLMLRFAANMGGSGLYVNKLKPDGRQDKEDYKNFDEKEFWENADKLYEEFSILYKRGFNKKDYNKELKCFVAGDPSEIITNYSNKTTCGLGLSQLTIDSDGSVYPCSALIDKNLKIGNIRDSDFSEIISKAKEIYKEVIVDTIEECKECDFRLLCGGGCRAMAYYANNDIKSCDPNCSSYKDRIKKWMNVSLLKSI